MEKLDTLVGDELSVISNIIVIEMKNIPKTQLSETLKYHKFEGVIFEILDLESRKYEIIDFFN